MPLDTTEQPRAGKGTGVVPPSAAPRDNDERRPYFPFYADDWAGGTMAFTLEQEGFYLRFVRCQWARRADLPHDIKWLALALRCDVRRVRRLLQFLIDNDKVRTASNGMLYNPKMRRLIEEDQTKIDRKSGQTRSKLRANLRETVPKTSAKSTKAHPQPEPEPKPEREERVPKGTLVASATPDDPKDSEAVRAFEEYNQLARRIGLAQAQTLTPARRKAIKARMREHGGLKAWAQALSNIEQSAFLQGRNDRCWKADLGFVVQASKFAKLVDGAYGNGAHVSAAPQKTRAMEALERRMAAPEALNG